MLALVILLASGAALSPSPAPGPLLAAAATQQTDRAASEAAALRDELRRLQGAVEVRDRLLLTVHGELGAMREQLGGVREELRALRDRPQPVAAPFLSAAPVASDRLGVARNAVLAPRVDVESFLRHDTVYLKLKRVEATAVRLIAELELTPDLNGIDLPLDQSGALYIVDWSTSDGHVFNLLLRDGASGQPAASVPVREKQSEGRFVLVGYRVD